MSKTALIRAVEQAGRVAQRRERISAAPAPGISAEDAERHPFRPSRVVPSVATRADELGAMAGVYPASKIAVARWVRRHAVTDEWIGAGIRLIAVAPGVVDTAMVAVGGVTTSVPSARPDRTDRARRSLAIWSASPCPRPL